LANKNQYLKPRPEALKKIKHIVVLMMENRSFDNMLGWLYENEKPPRGQHYEGLSFDLWNPLNNVDSNGNPFVEKVYVRKNGGSYKLGHKTLYPKENLRLPDPDPGEGYRDTTDQLYGTYIVDNVYPPAPTALGYVNNYQKAMLYGAYAFQGTPTDPREIMNCFTPEQTPVLSTLAKKYAVLDRYYGSVPSQTLPNRAFTHAATSNGYVNNKPDYLVPARTIFNQIQDEIEKGRKDLSWGIYSGTEKVTGTDEWKKFSLTRLCMVQLHDAMYNDNFMSMKDFYTDAAEGRLPSYTFLEPQFYGPLENDQHPPTDIRPGEKLIADVYEAVINSPKWEETLFVITYDEHGGTYDHYPPTEIAVPPDKHVTDGQMGFRFNRFGVRVPTVVISPFIKKGTIGRPQGFTPFDHTSIIKTVQNCFGLEGHLTERDKAAPDLSCLLTLKKPRKGKPKVEPLPYIQNETSPVNDLHLLTAEILTYLSGKIFDLEEEFIHEFIHDVYEELFS